MGSSITESVQSSITDISSSDQCSEKTLFADTDDEPEETSSVISRSNSVAIQVEELCSSITSIEVDEFVVPNVVISSKNSAVA